MVAGNEKPIVSRAVQQGFARLDAEFAIMALNHLPIRVIEREVDIGEGIACDQHRNAARRH
ncbi:hypothetical protein [Mesorhizobium sp.]|uniref:hypothetical protein n=1 Tax=Mesorhizobium sp. TaxID=1871066 RepID=UPI00257CCE6C|nr:hypothetical protein [Mesorhizobium sp.]